MSSLPPTWIEIALEAIQSNFRLVKDFVSPAKVISIVKADAYGHGAVPVARALQQAGTDFLGVASLDEALELKDSGADVPILIVGPLLGGEVDEAVRAGLRITAYCVGIVEEISKSARKQGCPALVHAKIDTGMGRIGMPVEEGEHFVRFAQSQPGITVEGVLTHFSSADCDAEFTIKQLDRFKRLLAALSRGGLNIPLAHAANSAAIFNFPESHLQAVRPGLAIYGIAPSPEPPPVELKPALSFRTTVVMVKSVPASYPVSYGRTHITSKKTILATLPVGYRHGLPRILSNQGEVLIRGRRAPIVGQICMDQMMVDVGGVREVTVGDVATIYGEDGDERKGVEEMSQKAQTIPYELLCALDKRIPRGYLPR